jgi:hypothetical protein
MGAEEASTFVFGAVEIPIKVRTLVANVIGVSKKNVATKRRLRVGGNSLSITLFIRMPWMCVKVNDSEVGFGIMLNWFVNTGGTLDHTTLGRNMFHAVDEEYSWTDVCEYFERLVLRYQRLNCAKCQLPLMLTLPFVFIPTVIQAVRIEEPKKVKPHQFVIKILDKPDGVETLAEILSWLYQ